MSESLDDLIKKRMEERNTFSKSIEYNTNTQYIFNNIEFEEKKITKATYNPNDVPLDFKNNEPQYFLEFYNKETIKIHYDGMFETDPPILRFRNDYDNSTVPYEWIEDKILKLIIKIGEKKFDYIFDKHDFIRIKEKEDERFVELNKQFKNIINPKTETIFYKLSDHKNSDDSMYKMVFAYYKDKVVFRYGSLPMIKDEAYHEMFGKDNQ